MKQTSRVKAARHGLHAPGEYCYLCAKEREARIDADLPPPVEPQAVKRPKDPYLGQSIPALMNTKRRVGKGGSKSGRRKATVKRGTVICQNCKIERKYCDCSEYEPRSFFVASKVSAFAQARLRDAGASSGFILETIARIYDQPESQALAEIERLFKHLQRIPDPVITRVPEPEKP